MSVISGSGGLQLTKLSTLPQELETCICMAADANNIFIGDAVIQDATNYAGSIGNYGKAAQAVTKASNSGPIYGVVVGFKPQDLAGNGAQNFSSMYRPASTAMYVLIRRANPNDLYSIMDDGTLASGARGALGITNIGLNANLIVSTSGNTNTGMSSMSLAGSTAATTANLQLKIVDVVPAANNNPAAVNARWIVQINNCASNTGGTGVAGT